MLVITGTNTAGGSGGTGSGLGVNLSEGGSGSGGGSGGRSSPQGGSRSGSGSATPTRPGTYLGSSERIHLSYYLYSYPINLSQSPKFIFDILISIGNEDTVEAMDVTGSNLVLNAASYVLSSQLGDKVKLTYCI